MKLIANLANIDRKATDEYGIPSLTLMETAGAQVARQALCVLDQLERAEQASVLILCGPGNNGGDGFVCARHLARAGFSNITVWHPVHPYQGDALSNLEALQQDEASRHVRVDAWNPAMPITLPDTGQTEGLPDLIIDALFGSGLNRPVGALYARWIAWVNQLKDSARAPYVLAVDVPSGIDGASGDVLGEAIRADATVTFAAVKPGLMIHPGKAHAGAVLLTDIGIPQALIDDDPGPYRLITEVIAAQALPKRDPLGHKYSFGSVLVLAGSQPMPGAACLCAEAALTSGAGIVTVATPDSVFTHHAFPSELVRLPLPHTLDGYLTADALSQLLVHLADAGRKTDTLLIGPGLGQQGDTQRGLEHLLPELAKNYTGNVVLDADALNALAAMKNPPMLTSRFIITPHLGEAKRLLHADTLPNLAETALQLHARYGATVVLKSATTLITRGKQVWINSTGNDGMATAGSGDVLAGILAGLLAQGKPTTEEAIERLACCAVFLHGRSGDLAAQEITRYSLRARDLINWLPETFQSLGAN